MKLTTILSLLIFFLDGNESKISTHPKVIFISLDGFGDRFFIRGDNPNLYRFGQLGVKADYLTPMFPSKTPNNHIGIAMGMYTENHGILATRWNDEKGKLHTFNNSYFNYARPNMKIPLPIWTLNEAMNQEEKLVRPSSYPAPATTSSVRSSYPAPATTSSVRSSYPAPATTSSRRSSYPAPATTSSVRSSYPAPASTSSQQSASRRRGSAPADIPARQPPPTPRWSAVSMWAGGEYYYDNRPLPRHLQQFNRETEWHTRIRNAIQWMTDEQNPANLVLMYFDQPDKFIHDYGTEHPTVQQQLEKLDEMLIYLLSQLRDAQLLDVTNVIITSDHGMAEFTLREHVNFYPFTDPNKYYISDENPFNQIRVKKEEDVKEVYDRLQDSIEKTGLLIKETDENGREISITLPKFKMWRKKDIPERWRFKENSRVAHFVILTNVGFSFFLPKWTNMKQVTPDGQYPWRYGLHGWDPAHPLMRGIFLACGPNFEAGKEVDGFENIHVYPLLMEILNIPQTTPLLTHRPIDGKLDRVKHLLREKPFAGRSPLRSLLDEHENSKKVLKYFPS